MPKHILTLFGFVLFMLAPSLVLAAGESKGVNGSLITFYAFGAFTLFGGIMTISRRNPIHAALFLVLTLIGVAGIYLSLHATFLAIMQVLVYAGAIMVLFIFVVMSLGPMKDEPFNLRIPEMLFRGAGAIAILFLAYRLVNALAQTPFSKMSASVPKNYGDVAHMGEFLFGKYLFPFEAISILLLVAIVGAVMISRSKISKKSDEESAS